MAASARRAQAGFSFIEVLVSIVILAIVAGAIFQGFAASSAQIGRSRLDSVSSKLAQGVLEQANQLKYDDIGVVGGNPPGTMAATATRTLNGTAYQVATSVVYVNDPAKGQATTYIDYKKVTVTVTPQTPLAKAVTASTLIAPPSYASISGKATAIVTVVDSVTLQPLTGASVTMAGSTSPTRIDSTDATGKATFAGLLPSATSASSPQYYYLASATLNGYLTDPSTGPTVTRQNLASGQTWNVTIKMYKPATIYVNVKDSVTGNPVTEYTDITITNPAPSSTAETFTTLTGTLTATTILGTPIMPSSSQFTVKVNSDCYPAAQQQLAIPAGYPVSTSQVINFTLVRPACGWLDVWVKNSSTNAPLAGASVQVSGGPSSIATLTRPTDANGYTRFSVPSGTTPYTVAASMPSGYSAGSLPATVGTNLTTPVTLKLVKGSTGTGTATVNTSLVNTQVRIIADNGSWDVTQITNSSKYAKFTGVPVGTYKAYRIIDAVSIPQKWSAPVAFTVFSATNTNVTVP